MIGVVAKTIFFYFVIAFVFALVLTPFTCVLERGAGFDASPFNALCLNMLFAVAGVFNQIKVSFH